MRDAIIYGYDWAGAGTITRVALAAARAGAKVLYCEGPGSVFRRAHTSLHELESNLFTIKPRVLASRLNRYPGMSRIQGAAVASQILAHADALGLKQPSFVYAYPGLLLVPLCQAMKARGYLLVHVYANYWEGMEREHVEQSDLTLVISRTAFHRLRARWGDKIHHIPHGVDLRYFRRLHACPEQAPPLLAAIPRPRLGYAGGAAEEHLNTRVLRDLLERRPDWNFISFQWRPAHLGMKPAVSTSNAHVLPWQGPEGFARCVAGFDIGFMPYDCSNVVLFNGPPMKLWDYFALGLPVVATPLIHLWEYEGLVYLGDTAKELERAVEAALAEPPDSPLRQKRKELAEEHSVEALGQLLGGILV
ncbi:MAG TPA: hypothetical protein VGS20_14940 [Candidatus Acidoferrales bacterium]|nr:hypothetical protein [Candidatus Acidoferrales bacterium]